MKHYTLPMSTRGLSLFLLACILLVPLALHSQSTQGVDTTVDFVMGTVELEQTGTWRTIKIGTKLPSTAKIRLAKEARLELNVTSGKIIIDRPGTYLLKDLVEKASAAATYGIDSMISRKLGGLSPQPNSGKTAVGGVRAASAEPSAVFQDASVLLRAGMVKLHQGEPEAALGMLEDAFANQLEDDGLYYYYYALCLHLLGRSSEATGILDSMPADTVSSLSVELLGSQEQLTAQILILRCLVSVPSQDAGRLINACNKALDFPGLDIESRQEVLLLKALGWYWQGKTKDWRGTLEELIGLQPDSQAAIQARKLLD